MTRQHHCTNCLALPAFLLAISGPFLTVYGAIFLDTLAAEPLTEALWMVPWKHMQAKSTSLVHSVDVRLVPRNECRTCALWPLSSRAILHSRTCCARTERSLSARPGTTGQCVVSPSSRTSTAKRLMKYGQCGVCSVEAVLLRVRETAGMMCVVSQRIDEDKEARRVQSH